MIRQNVFCSLLPSREIFNFLGYCSMLYGKYKYKHMKKELIETMKIEPFGIMLDASNGTGLFKIFPVTVCIFNENFDRIMMNFLDIVAS